MILVSLLILGSLEMSRGVGVKEVVVKGKLLLLLLLVFTVQGVVQ